MDAFIVGGVHPNAVGFRRLPPIQAYNLYARFFLLRLSVAVGCIKMEKKIVITYNPRTGRYVKVPRERYNRWTGDIIQETKQCRECNCFKEVEVVAHPARTVLTDEIPDVIQLHGGVLGICIHGVAWKVVVKVEKPRKCMKV